MLRALRFARPLQTLAMLIVAACTSNEPIRPEPSAGAAPSCPSGRGPKMVAIVLPGVASFCIDSTEVSQAHYAEFLASKPDVAKQSRQSCVDWNFSFEPRINTYPHLDDYHGCRPDAPTAYDPKTKGDLPIACVDQCDAIAYCEWAGKRLCGKVGGGPRDLADVDPTSMTSEWYLACSQGGKGRYPYGDAYEKGRCDRPPASDSHGGFKSVAADACHGDAPPFDGLFDMVGNVAEWEDQCRAEGICTTRGGSADEAGEGHAISCASGAGTASHNQGFAGQGIRCCANYE